MASPIATDVRITAGIQYNAVVGKSNFLQFVDQLALYIALKITECSLRVFIFKFHKNCSNVLLINLGSRVPRRFKFGPLMIAIFIR
jgi:hypothetical protein